MNSPCKTCHIAVSKTEWCISQLYCNSFIRIFLLYKSGKHLSLHGNSFSTQWGIRDIERGGGVDAEEWRQRGWGIVSVIDRFHPYTTHNNMHTNISLLLMIDLVFQPTTLGMYHWRMNQDPLHWVLRSTKSHCGNVLGWDCEPLSTNITMRFYDNIRAENCNWN